MAARQRRLMTKENNNMNQKTIAALEEIIHSRYSNTAGMIVLKNGETQYEGYFNGCTADSCINIFSVTKSIISILIGIAVDRGEIQSVNQKVLDFFPDFPVENYNEGETTIRDITLRDLMTMTAPYKHQEEPYLEYFTRDDWVSTALELLGGTEKAGTFRYTPFIGPDILSGILVKATGQSVLEFAAEHLFTPLGITVKGSITLENQEAHYAFMNARDVSGWVMDSKGIHAAGWGLTLTARDMAKIGQLYLDGGKWDGKQIVSAQWIAESTREHSRWEELNLPYGYLWWIADENAFAAMGDSGNTIYVNRKKKLVIAIASLFKENTGDRMDFIKECVEPMFA